MEQHSQAVVLEGLKPTAAALAQPRRVGLGRPVTAATGESSMRMSLGRIEPSITKTGITNRSAPPQRADPSSHACAAAGRTSRDG